MAKKVKLIFGDIFAIPLLNNKFAIAQVLDLQMENIVRIALYDEVIDDLNVYSFNELCSLNKLISLIAVQKNSLSNGKWKKVGNKSICIPVCDFPNERFRKERWVGAVDYDEELAEDFLNSFYCLLPWDDWYNPNFLDDLLIDINKKLKNFIYKKQF